MTLDDVLEQSGVMLGVGKLPTADQLIAWREAIALHLAGMGEPVLWVNTAPPIDLTAVREVIAELRKADFNLCDEPADEWADKLEAAIATQTKEPRS